jgi:hypothetical protein
LDEGEHELTRDVRIDRISIFVHLGWCVTGLSSSIEILLTPELFSGYFSYCRCCGHAGLVVVKWELFGWLLVRLLFVLRVSVAKARY